MVQGMIIPCENSQESWPARVSLIITTGRFSPLKLPGAAPSGSGPRNRQAAAAGGQAVLRSFSVRVALRLCGSRFLLESSELLLQCR